MAKLPKQATGLQGVEWSFSDGYLHATSDVGALRVKVPGAAVLDQAASMIAHHIRSKRYALAH